MSDDSLEDLWQEAYAFYQKRQLKADNPYVADIIEILRPHKDAGLHRTEITKRLEQMRSSKGLPLAQEMDKSVQSSIQRHSSQYAGYKERKAPATDDLFFPSQGMGKGYWAVHLDKATAWLIAKNKSPAA